ncbi:inhibitor of growth protein 1-like [Aphis gossypii]|uniref:Inhibitor of growth protein n=1 Tax=Aphis gossypii TaxID=80765 RepID=A0A9P0J2E8_APHGO|nr:inhibitor of growth protein 1-like [Aphis gossypii]CAH1725370.1 unnamed protein product [Aphis gossypii]
MTDLENVVDRYFKNYDHIMKQLPPDGQRQASRYYEIDYRHSHIIKKLTNFTKNTKEFTSLDEQRMKKLLVESLHLADKKIHISECVLDMVEKDMVTLNTNFKEFEMSTLSCINKSNKNTKRSLKFSSDNKKIDDNSHKRPKRNITKTTTTTSNKSVENNANLDRKSSTNKNKNNTTSNKKYKAGSSKDTNVVPESVNSDSDDELQPTYCICEKISYGEMVCCDNDLCPIEWFHFGCVSIRKKPKGKWYCPQCRGTNSKTMKPKEIVVKKLEEYNKRKEENW